MKSRVFSLFLSLLMIGPSLWADDDKIYFAGIELSRYEIPFYRFSDYTQQVALRMEYAKFELGNASEWTKLKETHIAYAVDLVFTKYPEDIKAWRTDYHQLLSDRLTNLFALDSTLKHTKVQWNMYLQTQCDTEEEAKKYFHGFVIKFRPKRKRFVEEIRRPQQLQEMVSGKISSRDSTVFKILDRNNWDDMLVVTDWTGSMYKHGVQLVIWHKLNQLVYPDRVKHVVFFNDGNQKKTWQKKPGRTGGVYRSRSNEIEELVETMEFVMKKGDGGDPEENDIEALLTGIQYLEGYRDIILIADNKSDVRDLELLEKIDRPIHVIVCDVRGRINPHYAEIAYYTGGSLHTLKSDLVSKDQLRKFIRAR